jgi:hypothetical protein
MRRPFREQAEGLADADSLESGAVTGEAPSRLLRHGLERLPTSSRLPLRQDHDEPDQRNDTADRDNTEERIHW